MKNSKPLFFLFLTTLFIFSCSKDQIVDNDINLEEPVLQNQVSQETKTNRNNSRETEEVIRRKLLNKMEWISYITAQVLNRSANARVEFREQLGNPNSSTALSLNSMLGNPSVNRQFRAEFKRIFIQNYMASGGSCTNGGHPEGGPHPNGELGGRSSIDYDQIFEDYISSLLDDDCLEYYLPNGFAYFESTTNNNSSPIKSTSHPLSTSRVNSGFLFNDIVFCTVEPIRITGATTGIIIVVRPFRSPNCFYNEYDFDFNDFLY